MIYDDLELFDEREEWLEDISDDDRVEICPMCMEENQNCTCRRGLFLDEYTDGLFDEYDSQW